MALVWFVLGVGREELRNIKQNVEMEMLYRCNECKNLYTLEEICVPRWEPCFRIYQCRYCSHDKYFEQRAIDQIRLIYGLRWGQYCDDLLQIEIIRAKTRYVMMGKGEQFVTIKNDYKMITKVTNSTEMRQALNENLHAIITKKRKLLVAKEINNTLGKILIDVKMEIMQNALSGNRETISWFENNNKAIGEQYGVVPRLKQAQ